MNGYWSPDNHFFRNERFGRHADDVADFEACAKTKSQPTRRAGRERLRTALLFELEGDLYRSQVVWLAAPPKWVNLGNSDKTWLTARAGDLLQFNGQSQTISAVILLSVIPPRWNNQEVSCAGDWLAGTAEDA